MEPPDLRRVRGAMEPAWDDLREQRVLRGAREAKVRRVRQRRSVRVGLVVGSLLVVLAVSVGWGVAARGPDIDQVRVAESAAPVTPSASVLSLADGSRLTVRPNADVQVEVQGPDEVRLVQRAGEVDYQVAPAEGRQFEVRAAGVLVRVVGTAFQVRVDEESVHVKVQRGRVEVEDTSGTTVLGPGEELRRAAKAPEPVVSSTPEPKPTVVSGVAPPPSAEAVPSVEVLLAEADRARAAGRLDEAASALQRVLALHPKDKRVGSVLFTLGRVERARGNHAAAAARFHACGMGSLAEDALAEEAASWQAAGQTGKAREAAQRYLDRFPGGPHVARMQRIAR